jgi:glutamate 5-kinase
MPAKRRWIAYAADVRGRIRVNSGACEAIMHGKASLLWSGVIRVERDFQPLDVISIADADGQEFARGIANHGSEAAGGKAGVLVTRNNIVILSENKAQ